MNIEICNDIFVKISEYLCDRDKIHFTMISTKMDKFKYIFVYVEKISIDVIVNLPYYNNFENIKTKYSWYESPHILSHIIRSNNLLHLLNKDKLPNMTKYHHFSTNILNVSIVDLKPTHSKSLVINTCINDKYPADIFRLKIYYSKLRT
jgi:hypothetical protein